MVTLNCKNCVFSLFKLRYLLEVRLRWCRGGFGTNVISLLIFLRPKRAICQMKGNFVLY